MGMNLTWNDFSCQFPMFMWCSVVFEMEGIAGSEMVFSGHLGLKHEREHLSLLSRVLHPTFDITAKCLSTAGKHPKIAK